MFDSVTTKASPKQEHHHAKLARLQGNRQERGALALELYVVESKLTGDPELARAKLPNHLAYQKEMEAKGSLVLAGPLSDETGEAMHGVGLIVYRAASFEEARRFAEADPMHDSGARAFKLRRRLVNEGSLNATLSLSSQRGMISQPYLR